MQSIQWFGHDFDVLAERALHWRAWRTLIIADAHFGKAAAFRAAGVPAPAGTTRANLDRLDRALDQSGAERLIILGDLLHARDGRAESTMTLLGDWRLRHSKLPIVLVRGNHDHHAGDPPEDWNIQCVDEPWADETLVFCHEPRDRDPRGLLIAGHVHPCVRLHDVDGSAYRAPCFLFRKSHVIVPAFGSFTGGHPVLPRRGDRLFIIGPDRVVEANTAEDAATAHTA